MPSASWNQKYSLYIWAKENNYPKIYDFLDKNHITRKEMSQERYKSIRNAILFNNPSLALKLLEPYGRGVEKHGNITDNDRNL